MKQWDVLVEVSPRAEIADPAGLTIERALDALGFAGVSGVRVGKAIRLEVTAPDAETARAATEQMCERLLANPVIEDARIELMLRDNPHGSLDADN
ncbi:phosphoribosylformylglycinamidine synthase subunit PurS [Candidatus Poriferisodalis sp.]|uniref:phosphoribosylformylglycinamidine synthase subunit PurS n=1 Tax=Candidatus Poriferisodalis sp. TaxID=3101277 RepID=UPI003D0CCD0E